MMDPVYYFEDKQKKVMVILLCILICIFFFLNLKRSACSILPLNNGFGHLWKTQFKMYHLTSPVFHLSDSLVFVIDVGIVSKDFFEIN